MSQDRYDDSTVKEKDWRTWTCGTRMKGVAMLVEARSRRLQPAYILATDQGSLN
jgi:hypothetical protein